MSSSEAGQDAYLHRSLGQRTRTLEYLQLVHKNQAIVKAGARILTYLYELEPVKMPI